MSDDKHAGQPRLRTVAEVAEYLSMSRSSVYALMDAGTLRHVKIGKSRRVRWEDVESLVERNTHGEPPQEN